MSTAAEIIKIEGQMAWIFQNHPYQAYRRNPIELFLAQVRFAPILRIEDRISDYQEAVRHRFPLWQAGVQRTISLDGPNSFSASMAEEKMFRIGRNEWLTQLVLTRTSLTLEVRNHRAWADAAEDLQVSLSALERLFSPIETTRLGIRYINQLDRFDIGRDLNREVSWSELLNEEFLRIPDSILGLDAQSVVMSEIRSLCAAPRQGAMNLKFGFLPAKGRGGNDIHKYRFDADRYFDGPFELVKSMEILDGFRRDLYSIFRDVIGDSMVEWMSTQT